MSTAVIVDDYEDIAEVLEQYLKLLGIQTVAKGKNGMEAFELYRAYEPDFVYLDISMPIFDGFFAIEQIQKKYPTARIIMTTADYSCKTRQRLHHMGITEILYKPFDLQMLKTTLEKTRFQQFNIGIVQ